MKDWKAELLLFFNTLIWGATFMFTKIGLEDAPPSLYIIMRFIIALVLSMLLFGKHIFKANFDTVWKGLLLGTFFAGGFLLQTYGLKFTSVTKSAFITGIAVPMTPFIYKMLAGKNIKKWSIVGVTLATLGLWVFTDPGLDNFNTGDLFTLLSTIFWALYITCMDIFTKNKTTFSESAQLVMLQFIAAAPVSSIFFFIFEYQTLDLTFTPNLLISLAFNGIMASFIVTFIHTAVQKYTTPVKAALIFSFEPVMASIIAMIFLNEFLSLRGYIGAIILFSGIIISEVGPYLFGKKRRNT